jgi:formate dehydrogenase assembly factor FdhD
MDEFWLRPDPDDPRLTQTVPGIDQEGRLIETAVVHERPLTLFLNSQEIVTMMTIGDYPEYLAVGYLLNQNMLRPDDVIAGIDYDEELEVVVRTEAPRPRRQRALAERRGAPDLLRQCGDADQARRLSSWEGKNTRYGAAD